MSTSFPSLATIEQELTTAIGQQETSSGAAGVGVTLNNIGGLNYAPWESAYGATPTPNSPFATFPSLSQSTNALTQLIDNYIQKGASIQSMMNAYAPVANNPTTPGRITALAVLTGLSPTQSILSQVNGTSTTASNPAATSTTASTPAAASTSASTGSTASTVASVAAAATGWLNPSRIAAVAVGLIVFILGLSMLKSTQPIVQPIIETAKGAGRAAGESLAFA